MTNYTGRQNGHYTFKLLNEWQALVLDSLAFAWKFYQVTGKTSIIQSTFAQYKRKVYTITITTISMN